MTGRQRPPRFRPEALAGTLTLRKFLVVAATVGAAPWIAASAQAQDTTLYRGMCDASAAVALDATHFVVANDEDNTLRIFRRGIPQPVATMPLATHLQTARESDIEGAARIGQRIYWISSHGRNASAKVRTDRYRFFFTDIDSTTSPPTLKPGPAPHTNVLQQLFLAESLRSWRLADAAKLAPEAPGGLNIEGLAGTPDGQLLIGFRNPVRDGKALVATLRNPEAMAAGAAATFGPAISLDLGGRGVRSIDRTSNGYLLIAGPTADKGDFALYRWSGQPAEAPQRVPDLALGTLRPEALFVWPQSGLAQILSDDGGVVSGGVACKDRAAVEQAFRSVDFKL